jgi:uncharacterized protein involved in type VI secretion and phage assembly
MSLTDELDNDSQQTPSVFIAAGIVVNNKDEDGLGRVKLKFPMLSDENESDWVRIVSFMAGAERGAFFLPEVGDEVLVIFEHGNLNCPYVIGSLWNGKAKPPYTNDDDKNNIRAIKSRSGHQIIFCDDEEGKKENIEILTKAGHQIILDDTDGAELIAIIDKTKENKITLDSANNAIAIETPGAFTIKGDTVEIEGTTSLTLKTADGVVDASSSWGVSSADVKINGDSAAELTSAAVTVEGKTSLELKSAAIKVEGSANTEVKSGGVMTVQGSLTKIN